MTAGAHAGRRRRWRAVVALVLGIVLTVGGVWAAVSLDLLPESVSGDAGCTPTTVEVAVVPALAPTVEKATSALADECRDFDVVRRTTARVVRGASNGEQLPDVWIPDATWPLEALSTAGAETEVVSEGIASTPVVLVGGPAAESRTASWGDALQSGQVALPDPTTSTVGVMALVASQAEAAEVGRTEAEATALLAPVAQAYGERRADGVTDDVSLASITASASRLVPATEQDFIAAHRVNTPSRRSCRGPGRCG